METTKMSSRLIILVVLTTVCYNIYSGVVLQEIGIPGLLTFKFAKDTNEPKPPTSTETSLPSTWQWIHFQDGDTKSTLTTSLTPDLPKGYVLTIMEQQHMFITVYGNVSVEVLDPQYNPLAPISEANGQYEVRIPQTGDYKVVLKGEGNVSLEIYIPPL